MLITAVRIRRLVSSTRGYNHHAIEAEAAVLQGDDPNQIRDELTAWIDIGIRQQTEFDGLRGDLDKARAAVREVERRHDNLVAINRGLRASLDKFDEFLDAARKAGIPIPEALDDTLPF